MILNKHPLQFSALRVLAIVASLQSRSSAQEPTLASPYAAICEVQNWLGDSGPGGSGTLIETASTTKSYVLTANHIFNEGDERRVGKIYCGFPNKHVTRGRLVEYSEPMDVALIEIEQAPSGVTPVKLARLKAADEPFVAVGYPDCAYGQQRWRLGKFLRWQHRNEVIIDRAVDNGYSGGALVNRFGRQVGVITRTDDETSTHTAGKELIAFVERNVR